MPVKPSMAAPRFSTRPEKSSASSRARAPSRAGGASQDGGVALRATIARNFLDAHDVDYESGVSATDLKEADIGALAKGVVVLVECRR